MVETDQGKLKIRFAYPSEGVKWAVEEDGILLVNPKTETSLKLNQIESALWHLSTVKTPYHQLSLFIAVLSDVSLAEAEKFIEELFERWRELGYLESK